MHDLQQLRSRLQGWAFQLLYRHGHGYDATAWLLFGDEWHRWRQAALPWVQPGRILDLGCGTGALLHELARMASPFGLDVSAAMLRRARPRNPGLPLVRADAGALPFRDGSFQTVVATFPAPFILHANSQVEIARVLAPGGTLVVVMGGEITHWPVRRQPVRLLLRLFYGSGGTDSEVKRPDLSHPELPGEWHTAATERGRAHLWVATRVEKTR